MPTFVYKDYRNIAGTAFVYRTAVQSGPVISSTYNASNARTEASIIRPGATIFYINFASLEPVDQRMGPPVSVTLGGFALSWEGYSTNQYGGVERITVAESLGVVPAIPLAWGQSYDLVVTDATGSTATISVLLERENISSENFWGYTAIAGVPENSANDSFLELAETDPAFVGYSPANALQVQWQEGFDVNGTALSTPYNLAVDNQTRIFINPYSEIIARRYRILYIDDDTVTTRYIEGEFNFRTKDIVPSFFGADFPDVVDVVAESVVSSVAITGPAASYWGITEDVPLSVINGEYSLNGGAFTSVAGVLHPSDAVQLRTTAAPTYPGSVNVELTAGEAGSEASIFWGVTNYITAPDHVPDTARFADLLNQEAGTVVESDIITLSGFNVPLSLTWRFTNTSHTNEEIRINGGAWISIEGQTVDEIIAVVNAGDTVQYRITTSDSYGYYAGNIVLCRLENHGNIAWAVSVRAGISTPDAFAFIPVTESALSTSHDSNLITISGVDVGVNVPIYIDGVIGEYSVNDSQFVAASGFALLGDVVQMRATSSPVNATLVTAAINIGGVAGAFNITTEALVDAVPDPFSFVDVVDAVQSALLESNIITISGMNVSAAVSIDGAGEYRIDGGTWVAVSGIIANGQTIQVRNTSSAALSTAVSTTLNVGGIADTYTITTGSISLIDITPRLVTVAII